MKTKSRLQQCREIFSREITNPAEKIPSATRALVVGLFVSEAGAKPASANVYFSNIRREILNPVTATEVPIESAESVVAAVTATPVDVASPEAPEDHFLLTEESDGLEGMGEFEREFADSLDTADL